jgi:hypothetical protein
MDRWRCRATCTRRRATPSARACCVHARPDGHAGAGAGARCRRLPLGAGPRAWPTSALRFEQRREAAEAELHSLQDWRPVVSRRPAADQPGRARRRPARHRAGRTARRPSTHAAFDDPAADPAQWLQRRRSGEWVRMFMQGAWVTPSCCGTAGTASTGCSPTARRPTPGPSAGVRWNACCEMQLLTAVSPRSLIRDAASRVLRNLTKPEGVQAGVGTAGSACAGTHCRSTSAASPTPCFDSAENSVTPMSACSPASAPSTSCAAAARHRPRGG